MTDAIEERAREIVQNASAQYLTEHRFDFRLLELAITAALRAEYERGQRDMRERAVSQIDADLGYASNDHLECCALIAALSEHEGEKTHE